MKKILSYAISTGFGVGYFPVASGTIGSFAVLPLAAGAAHFWGATGILGLAILFYFSGVIAVRDVLKYESHDPAIIVIDEFVGQLIALLPLYTIPRLGQETNILAIYLVAFLLFRLFDITKPWPANYFDKKVMNAHGVMLDDVVAGLYAATTTTLISFFL